MRLNTNISIQYIQQQKKKHCYDKVSHESKPLFPGVVRAKLLNTNRRVHYC